MYLKRKSSHFSIEEDDEEDEWEREASSSISSRKQPQQPNQNAIQIDILDEQYETLCNTSKDLEEELKQLQETIRQLDQEAEDVTTESVQARQEYLDSIEKTISMINSTNNETEDDTIQLDCNTDYINYDELLSKDLNSRLDDWQDVLRLEQNFEEVEQKIKSLAHAYKYTEFEYMDLVAQINGYEARIQSLDRDRSRLNSLPQLLPILKSDTEKHQLEMEHTISLLTKLENETIRPRLIKLAELKISQPLREDQLFKDAKLVNDLLDDFKHISEIAMKQRACQQLVTYIYNQIESATNTNSETLESFTSELEDQANRISIENQASRLSINEGYDNIDEKHTKMIKNLLDEFFASKKDIALFTSVKKDDMTLVDQIHALLEYEQILKKKWEEDFQSCLDAAKELDGLQSRLSQSLYAHSNSMDNLIMTPKPYVQLQNELEFRTDELKASMSELQKYLNNTKDNSLFYQQKKLFSLFYTDPDKFVELHQEYANDNNDN